MQGRPHHVSNNEKTSGHAQAKMTQRVCNLYRGKTKKSPTKGFIFEHYHTALPSSCTGIETLSEAWKQCCALFCCHRLFYSFLDTPRTSTHTSPPFPTALLFLLSYFSRRFRLIALTCFLSLASALFLLSGSAPTWSRVAWPESLEGHMILFNPESSHLERRLLTF